MLIAKTNANREKERERERVVQWILLISTGSVNEQISPKFSAFLFHEWSFFV